MRTSFYFPFVFVLKTIDILSNAIFINIKSSK